MSTTIKQIYGIRVSVKEFCEYLEQNRDSNTYKTIAKLIESRGVDINDILSKIKAETPVNSKSLNYFFFACQTIPSVYHLELEDGDDMSFIIGVKVGELTTDYPIESTREVPKRNLFKDLYFADDDPSGESFFKNDFSKLELKGLKGNKKLNFYVVQEENDE